MPLVYMKNIRAMHQDTVMGQGVKGLINYLAPDIKLIEYSKYGWPVVLPGQALLN